MENFSRCFLGVLVLLFTTVPARAGAQAGDTIGRGNGTDGALSISVTDRAVAASDYSELTMDVTAGATSFEVADAAGFSAGNAVLIVQSQIPTDVSDMVPDMDPVDLGALDIGHFELARIAGVASNTITLETPLAASYVTPGAQAVRVREYTNVTVAAGRSLSAAPWDGRSGGVVAFVATGTVTVEGAIHADALGFRGGVSNQSGCTLNCSSPAREQCGDDGTGGVGENLEHNMLDGMPADDEYGDEACGTGNRNLGGGGGGYPRAGGGGGGNGGLGGEGGADESFGGVPGAPGVPVSMIFPDRISFGGGGGGGQTSIQLSESDGAPGGGAVFIHARQVVVPLDGRISADGADGENVEDVIGGQAQGAGGAGAGGTVLIVVGDEIDCTDGEVRSDGGEGGSFNTVGTAGGGGGGGGAGRVCLLRRVDACDGLQRGGGGGSGITGIITARDGEPGLDGMACEGPSPDCATSADCTDAARPICDTTTGLCQPCADDSQCVAKSTSAPRCVPSGGTRAGECVPCLEGDGATDCDDGNECTVDTCESTLTCQSDALPADTECSIGYCNGSSSDPRCLMCLRDEHCEGSLTCNPTTSTCRCESATQCDDGNECTDDACSSGVCSNTPVAADTACSGGFCDVAALPPECQECTLDEHCAGGLSCNLTTGTCRCVMDRDCDDGNECTIDTCTSGACSIASLPAESPCTGGLCDGAEMDPSCRMCLDDSHCAGDLSCNTDTGTCRCVEDADCDDGNECTADTCTAGVCANDPEPADTECTGGFCNPTTDAPRCQMCTRDEHCDGALSCNTATGSCECVSDGDCDDGNACTEDRCEADECTRTNVPEGDACVGETGFCTAGTPPRCVDCLEDADCPGGRCDPATNACEADGGVDAGGVADGGGIVGPDGGAGFDGGGADASREPGGAAGGGGCAVSEPGAGRGGAAFLLALLAFAFVRNRRGRRPFRPGGRPGGRGASGRGSGALFAAGALLASVSLMPAAAGAQTIALDRYGPGETPEDDFALSRPNDLGHLRFGAQLHAGYALNPLVYEGTLGDASTEQFAIVEHQLDLTLGLSLGLFDRVVVYGGLPVTLAMEGDDASLSTSRGIGAADGPGLGDAYLGARVRIYGEADDLFVLGAQATMTLPTALAGETSYRGEDHVTFHGELLGALQPGLGSRIVLNLGARVREEDEQAGTNLRLRHELTWGIGFAIPVWTDEADANTHLDVTAQIFGATAFAEAFEREQTALEGNLGARFLHGTGLVAGIALGPGMARGIGTPDFRAIAMIGYRTPRETEPPVSEPVDTDGDGILDPDDQCPTEPEDADGFQDEDGCPDADNDGDGILDPDDGCPNEPETVNDWEDEDGCPDEIGDTDGDGILDDADACVEEPEDADGFQDEDGCPDVDNDGDGILDGTDACPDEAGPLENRGCPDTDRDGDTVVDRLDNCPDEPGPPENQGCAEEQQVIIQEDRLEITDAVYFETASATIQERSFGLLLNVARVMNAHPELEHIVVEGHTDHRGDDDYNMRLSQSRAESVRTFLVEEGEVEAGRLEARGFGETRPVVEDATSAVDMARNRRVEFRIPRQEAASEPAEGQQASEPAEGQASEPAEGQASEPAEGGDEASGGAAQTEAGDADAAP